MKTWEEFKRFQNSNDSLDFYGCVNKDGVWFDSSESFEVALHFCCLYNGVYEGTVEEVKWMATKGHELGYSIIHGTMLKQMYEKGLIK